MSDSYAQLDTFEKSQLADYQESNFWPYFDD